MHSIKSTLLGLITLLIMLPSIVFSAASTDSGVALQGFDPVAYFTDNKPEKGNGDHVVFYDGLNYLFVNDNHKKTFEADPQKYLPQYGGWCAFGVSVGKKFVSDPAAWKIVDGKLYVNLNQKVNTIWAKDIPGNIAKANKNWARIKDIEPSKL